MLAKSAAAAYRLLRIPGRRIPCSGLLFVAMYTTKTSSGRFLVTLIFL
ncbi:hypothetical protein BRYFOR_09489 [Marvinbryantia formatexigens DSM 14469]|uniref:Uncharacterized protein n=1 Tax=Marvinbryantia formatexigens DSM 14469 TaxID=478749 RepID=C6LLE2_9FIRM|nr:hypothetical protein BRYFOR_09489 [Marvinbryantia formatexigens DSM 14469]